MKSILLITILICSLLIGAQCHKDTDIPVPACIQQKIEDIKAQPKWNPVATVKEYVYGGRHVYLFSSDCCDQYYMLYDGSCTYICAPYGGLSGNGDGNCPDFKNAAQFVKTIWKDPR
jgi:hypothetical protein